jgi:hypothetical protein
MNRKILALSIFTTVCTQTYAQSPLYLEVMVGNAEQTEKFEGLSDISADETSVGFRVGYNILEYLAVELGYHDYGEADDTVSDGFGGSSDEKIETTSVNFGLKGILPLTNGFSLNARLGVFQWDYEYNSNSVGFSGSGDDDGTDIYYGIGGAYQITEVIGLGIEYTVMDHEASIEGFKFDRELENIALSLNISI